GEDDETRTCWSPMAAGALAGEDDQVFSRLDDPDPVRDATRSFAVVAAIAKPPRAPGHPRRERLYLALACVSMIIAAGGLAVGLTPRTVVATSPLTAELDQERQQSAPYLARLQELERELAAVIDVRDDGAQAAASARGEVAQLASLLRHERGEAARLREADDRVALAEARIAAL